MPSILLVADDASVTNQVTSALADPATSLVISDEPGSVAELISRQRFDLVLVDMQIKSMGGMAVTRLVKETISLGEADTTPVVMLLDRSADTFLAKRAGSDAHLVKPFTAQDLRLIMTSLIPVS